MVAAADTRDIFDAAAAARTIGAMPAGPHNRPPMPTRREALLWALAGGAAAIAVILGLLLAR
jgi:hypothetical protein